MAIKRSYSDGCAAAHALDLVGERWALLLLRELLLGPKRFTELRTGLVGVSPNVLSQRLTELEAASVLRRRKLSVPSSAWVYELTDWGQQLEPVLLQLGRWGAQSPAFSPKAILGVDSFILSLRTMFDPNAASQYTASITLQFENTTFHATIANGKLDIVRTSTKPTDATIKTDPNTLVDLVYGGANLDDALKSGKLQYDGRKSLIKQFLRLFPLPEQARANIS